MKTNPMIESKRQQLSTLLEKEIKSSSNKLIPKSIVRTLSMYYSMKFEKLQSENVEYFGKLGETQKSIEDLKLKNQDLLLKLRQKKLANRICDLIKCYKENFVMGLKDFKEVRRFLLVKISLISVFILKFIFLVAKIIN